MATSTHSRPAKRRVGRKRLPPLAQGPAIQFVIATHPAEFKGGDVMRNVRSHVMYKHREQRGPSHSDRTNSREGSTMMTQSQTPSPKTSHSHGWIDENSFLSSLPVRRNNDAMDLDCSPLPEPMRSLAARILSTIMAEPARSAPPLFENAAEFGFSQDTTIQFQSLQSLRQDYISTTDFFCHDVSWMQYVCHNRLLFLSHISISCVYRDLAEGLLYNSNLTVYAKTSALQGMTHRLDIDDSTLVSILHLLIGEMGGIDESVLDVHMRGILRIVHQRGGLCELNTPVATFTNLVMLSVANLRGHVDSTLLQNLAPRRSSLPLIDDSSPVSPLCAPYIDLSRIDRNCSIDTIEIIGDMQLVTQTFLARYGTTGSIQPTSLAHEAVYDAQLHQLYSRLLSRQSAELDVSPDWVYESCRLAALIFCRSIVHCTSFADSAHLLYPHNSGSHMAASTYLLALQEALMRTDTASCWSRELQVVFLWVCLVGGAASWSPAPFAPMNESIDDGTTAALAKKFFALYAIKASVSTIFEQAETTTEALMIMLRIRQWVESTAAA